jgi:hypothetical protein
VTTLESFVRALGLLWERLHVISAGTVQSAGVRCEWTQELRPIGDQTVPMGELVELHVTLDRDHPIADTGRIRLDILEFDWLFTGGFDDPVASLKPPNADPPDGDFTIEERLVSQATTTPDLPTLQDVVDDFRVRHADDYERGILVVRDGASQVTDVVAWWRAQHVSGEDAPSLYFVAEIPERRSSSTVPLRVATPMPGLNVRVTGEVRDVDPAALTDAQPVPAATVTLGAQTARTTPLGLFVLDLRLPLGASTLTVARPGIDARTLTLTVTERSDHGFDIAVADEQKMMVATRSLAAGAGDQAFVLVDLTLRARVHRLAGTVVWPSTWTPGATIPLPGRYVYALPLAAGAALPQRPKTSREWQALRGAPGVLRSARPGAPTAREATSASGGFEISFIDLRAGAQHLIWVDGPDPRVADARVCEVIVRTVAAPDMRQLAFTMTQAAAGDPFLAKGPLVADHTDRRAVDSTVNLLSGDIGGACEVVRVVDAGAAGSHDLRLVRPGRANPPGFDATPPVGTEELDIVDATMQAGGLILEVLPLLPVFETPDRQSEPVRAALRRLHDDLDRHFPRGYLTKGTRWVLDARRTPVATWNDAVGCAALERTLLTHPLLRATDLNNRDWRWWRADAVSAADFARINLGAAQTFASRTLLEEFVPVLVPPVPRLLALFENRHAHISPGHGVYCDPPELAAGAYRVRTFRGDWAGNDSVHPTVVENWGGEDENVAAMAMHLRRITDANGLSTLISRESLDPTRLGIVQIGGAFAEVDPILHPDYPRLWQQSAYYWIAADWDAAPVGATIVRGHATTSVAADSVNGAAVNARMTLLRRDVGMAGRPVDAFLPIHTNAAANPNGQLIPARRGLDVMYLDIRPAPGPPDPGGPGYAEANTLGQDAAQRLADGVASEVRIPSNGAVTYWSVRGNITIELTDTAHHWRDGQGARDQRSAVAGAGLVEVTFPPGAPRPDVPIGFVELGFHSNPEEAACLAQEWFRHAGAVGMAEGLDGIIGAHSRPVDWDDVRALLTRTYGAIASVTGLVGAAVPMTPADVTDWVRAVTGSTTRVVATTVLADVIAAIEAERDTLTRELLAQRVADAVATVAGWTADRAQAGERARAALGPVLRALTAPASTAVPAIADLPRRDRPATRSDAAAAIGAAIGVRPLDLATVTAAVNGVTVLPAVVPEAPEAFVAMPTLTAAVTALRTLGPADIWRLSGVRISDPRGVAMSRVTPRETVVLAVDMAGTAWRGAATDVQIIVSRGGAVVTTLGCTRRTEATLTSESWVVPAGTDPFTVSAQVKHPVAGGLPLAAAPGTIQVGAR